MLKTKPIVAKFGGSSMADAESIRHVIQIISSDSRRHLIVVSAPGRSTHYPEKVTDQLLSCDFSSVEARFLKESRKLGWKNAQTCVIRATQECKLYADSQDVRASRGEWLSAQMLADLVGGTFIDATEIIRINDDGTVNKKSYDLVREKLANQGGVVVIPGFYGLDSKGKIKTFPRGGSDITGAIIARGVGAQVYENWTDVNGVMTSDPKYDCNAKTIDRLTVDRMIQMAKNGAKVLHPDSLEPMISSGIPVRVRNTFDMDGRSTLVTTL